MEKGGRAEAYVAIKAGFCAESEPADPCWADPEAASLAARAPAEYLRPVPIQRLEDDPFLRRLYALRAAKAAAGQLVPERQLAALASATQGGEKRDSPREAERAGKGSSPHASCRAPPWPRGRPASPPAPTAGRRAAPVAGGEVGEATPRRPPTHVPGRKGRRLD